MLHLLITLRQWYLNKWVLVQVIVVRGQQTYSYSAAGYTMLAESHLFHARYPVLTYRNNNQLGGSERSRLLITLHCACFKPSASMN